MNDRIETQLVNLDALRTGEEIHKAMEEAILCGYSHVTVAVDPAEYASVTHHKALMIVDETYMRSAEVDRIITALEKEQELAGKTVDLLVLDSFLDIGKIPIFDQTLWDLDNLMHQPIKNLVDAWHPKQLSKKKYQAPRQSFRKSLRSVNRNR